MKAIRVHTPGGPEAMKFEEIPDPVPGPGQVVVQIEAAGVNFVDIYNRSGLYKNPVPFQLGQEASGIVELTSPDVHEVKRGDRVAYQGVAGAYAEYAAVPAMRVVKVPDGLSTRTAAAALLQGMTAHYLSHSTY
ncbi:MAG: alcohol dehydrogenase catalytic domain-containing protein, partial [Chloroflexi bacterium]|nr:alcohol dehydrogenase catalytic domain-containing protein [Chloroflexota bacterium]